MTESIGVHEVIGILQLLNDWGHEPAARIYADSSAALGIVQRKGCGKLRHIRVGMLWSQDEKASGDENSVSDECSTVVL